MPRSLPSGTVTFLFTDVEGSTRLLHALGAEAYADALATHRRLLRQACVRHGGVEVDTQGDALFVAFPTAPGALAAAREATAALADGPIRVRIGLHTGSPLLGDEGYIGPDVHKGARIAAAGHGGQVLLSKETRDLVEAEVSELGEHRLKDFASTVPIFQLGSEHFPPLKTISNTNLPRPASSFVGREREVGDLTGLLTDGARFLTLTGPGGTGKTRLALEAAAGVLPEFRAGVFWVGLATLRDPALVSETIAHTLGAKDRLADHIGEREMLLLLDNLEQVVEAAPALAELVEACPHLRLVTTSRERLRVRGEVEYPVPPLADLEAVALFSERARVEVDGTVQALCRALDNLPLAIELAAARASVLTPPQILARLGTRLDLLKGGRDADPRQLTLRATIAWSHELLAPDEQRHFARLSVFRGGWTLGAAEQVVDADLDILQSLVDKSLVRHRDQRFSMLETIREYAGERLEASGEGVQLRRRHARHFLRLAEEAEPHLLGESSKMWLDRLEHEHDNLRAALDAFAAAGESELVLRLAAALSEFWDERGHLTEGRRRLERALASDLRPTEARGGALNGAAALALSGGDTATATRWAEEALALHRDRGDARHIAQSLLQLGAAVGNEGDLARARQLLQESVRLSRESGDENQTLWALRYLAWACHELGDAESERLLLEEALGRARAMGHKRMEASAIGALAMISLDSGQVEQALSMLAECHSLHTEHGDRVQIAINLCRVARALAVAGRVETAARVLACGETARKTMGARVAWVDEMNGQTLAAIRPQVDGTSLSQAWEDGGKLSPDEALALAMMGDADCP